VADDFVHFKSPISNLREIRLVGTVLITCREADGRAGMTQLTTRLANKRTCLDTSQLMLYREMIAVCSQIHTKHINALYGRNVEFLNVGAPWYIK
jgi:hypothetical protein